MDARSIGFAAEQRACIFLEKKGMKTVARNYRCAAGEIDLIMQDKENIVFVEVRVRSHAQFASAIESVTPAKQRKIINTALHYLQSKKSLDKVQCRFDVIGVASDQFDWVKDAFTADHF